MIEQRARPAGVEGVGQLASLRRGNHELRHHDHIVAEKRLGCGLELARGIDGNRARGGRLQVRGRIGEPAGEDTADAGRGGACVLEKVDHRVLVRGEGERRRVELQQGSDGSHVGEQIGHARAPCQLQACEPVAEGDERRSAWCPPALTAARPGSQVAAR